MLCRSGRQIFGEYGKAVARRGQARDRLLLGREAKGKCEEFLFVAEREYSRAFVAWVTHRGLCTFCRASSVREDLAQFASV